MKKASLSLFALTLATSSQLFAANISLEQITTDINYLASEQLKGRANFSPEIEQAADYIAKRFQTIGLKQFNNSYKQKFVVHSRVPSDYQLTLNGEIIANEQLAFVSSEDKINWQTLSAVSTQFVDKDDNLRQVMSEINQVGGDHLVLIHPQHQALFTRYKQYLNRGTTSLSNDKSGTIVAVISENEKVDSFHAMGTTTLTKKSLNNVVGVLPGKSLSNEYVLYSAHYDHLGVTNKNSDEQNDVIFNGADDNASGTTAIINLAQHFKTQNQNERSLIFVAFSAEEIGGFGSQYFSKQLEPNSITAMINLEMIGKPSKFGRGNLWMTGKERSNLGDILNRTLKSHGKEIHADPYPAQNLFYRSDNATLARLGVPAHSFSSTQLDKDQHYHQVSDDVSTLDLNSMKQVIDTIAIATLPIVKGKATPSRVDTTKINQSGKIY